MDEADRSTLQTNRTCIVKNIQNVEDVKEGLFEKKIITDGMKQQIEAEKTKNEKIRAMLDIIPRRGPTAFNKFMEVLVDTDNSFIVESLKPGFVENYAQSSMISQPVQENSGKEDQPLPEEWPTEEHCVTKGFTVKTCQGQAMMRMWNDVTNNYKMKNSPRGRAVIINNSLFKVIKDENGKTDKKSLPVRTGSNKDEEALETLFTKLHFDVTVHKDRDSQQMLEIVKSERNHSLHEKAECFILVILTHGAKEGLYGHDNKIVKLAEIESSLDGQSWPVMKDKPKLLLIQACRGDIYDKGISADVADGDLPDTFAKMSVNNSSSQSDKQVIPTVAHMLRVQATTEDFVSFRNKELGSWFIQAVVFVFRNYAHKDDVESMLTKVANLVAKGRAKDPKTQKVSVAVSEKTSKLTKKLYFFPGLEEMSSTIAQPTDN